MTDIIIITLEIIVGLLSAYLIYYAQQKGKNQADKEDLKKLTEVVEDVKRKNNEEIELLKANLSILTDKKAQLFTEEKEAIIVFYSQLNKWIWDSLNLHLNEYNHTNYTELSNKLIQIREAYNSTNVAFAKVQLLVKDENLIKAGHEAIMETLKLHHFKEGLMQQLTTTLAWEKGMVESLLSNKEDLGKLPELRDFYKEQAQKRDAEKKAVWEEYLQKNQEFFGNAIKKINSFKDLAKKYLNE